MLTAGVSPALSYQIITNKMFYNRCNHLLIVNHCHNGRTNLTMNYLFFLMKSGFPLLAKKTSYAKYNLGLAMVIAVEGESCKEYF